MWSLSARAAQGRGQCLELPASAPPVAQHLFHACTEHEPADRPTAAEIVNILRAQ